MRKEATLIVFIKKNALKVAVINYTKQTMGGFPQDDDFYWERGVDRVTGCWFVQVADSYTYLYKAGFIFWRDLERFAHIFAKNLI